MNNTPLRLTHYNIAPEVDAFSSTRHGGVGEGNYSSFNINPYCGDTEEAVGANVDVPLCLECLRWIVGIRNALDASLGNGTHVERPTLKGSIHLVAHLKVVERDAWSYHSLELTCIGVVGHLHIYNDLANNARKCASPSGMNSCNGVVLLVVEKHWYTVGSRHTYADTALICEQSVHSVE